MTRPSPPGVVRIIGGRWKRTPLPVVSIPGLRPTPDRVRKTVFDWLAHAFDRSFDDVTCLDLYAGSGALGLEAASRGARHVTLVERDADAAGRLRSAVTKLGATAEVRVREGTAASAIADFIARQERFDVVFLDPPFQSTEISSLIAAVLPLCRHYLYVEADRAIDGALADAVGLTIRRSARAGSVFYHLLQRKNNEETVDASSDLPGDV